MVESTGLAVSEFSKLTTSIYSAAIGQSTWESFLDDLSLASGRICTHLFGFDIEAGISMDLISSGYDPAFIDTYREHFFAVNSWAPGFAKHESGRVVDCESMCASKELKRTEFYNDWLQPQENLSCGGGALLFKNKSRFFAIGGNIRGRDEEKLKDGWLKLVSLLIPHLQQAFDISRALAGSKLESIVTASEGLRQTPGILMLSESGGIVFANAIAEDMIAKGRPISCNLRGVLHFGSAREPICIDAAFLKFRLPADSPSLVLDVPRRRQRQGYRLRFARLTPEAGIPFPLDWKFGVARKCVLLLIEQVQNDPDLFEELGRAFGLTKAEANVALSIGDGLSVREISSQRKVSIHTVRNQIKSAMSKCGVRRQAQLVALVRSSPSPLAPSVPR